MTSSCLVSRISKYEIRSRLSSAVNLMSGLSSFNISLKVFRLLSPEFQTIKQSSRYLFQLVKIYFPVSSSNVWLTFLYIVSSKYPRANVAYVGAIFVPMAVPLICLKCLPLNVKVLFVRTISTASKIKSFRKRLFIFSGFLFTQYLIASSPRELDMLLYKLITSSVTNLLFSSIFHLERSF